MNRDETLAVFYRFEDYVGVWRRLLIDGIDTFVAVFVSLFLSMIAFVVTRNYLPVIPVWAAVWIAYFVFLKGSRFRTLGYKIGGAQIVDFHGRRPGHLTLLGRLAFAILGPLNFLVDLCWVSSDPTRQAVRDKIARTYVIRSGALPAGTGRLVYRVYHAFGWTLMFAEVSGS